MNTFQFYTLVGDLNAHEQWGSSNNSRVGNLLVASLDNYQAVLLNSTSPPLHTYFPPPPNQLSVLDIAIVSSPFAPFCSFELAQDFVGSDHLPVIIKAGIEISRVSFFSHKLALTPIQWKHLLMAIVTVNHGAYHE